jgi:hypothetical protein
MEKLWNTMQCRDLLVLAVPLSVQKCIEVWISGLSESILAPVPKVEAKRLSANDL